MLIVCVLCYQISIGRYTTKEQGDILEKIIPIKYMIKIECEKGKCKGNCNKNWVKSIKYGSCTLSIC